jgi:SH3-like domain-containing protein
MLLPRPLGPATLLLLVLGAGAAAQTVAPGSLPPPRPVQPTAPSAPAPAPAPSPAPPAQPSQPQQRPASQTQARPPQQAPRPAQQQTRPPAQAQRPAGQAPTVGSQTPPQNRRPGAAAGAAAGAAGAAGAAAAANRVPEPPAPAVPAPPPAPTVGPVSGFPLPRYASLRSDQVNMRVGPNTTFPIEWTFQRRDLPVQIIGEFQVWRRIRDAEGAEGWVHQSTLQGRRTALIRPPRGGEEVVLRRAASAEASEVARLRGGVIVRVRECEANNPWCEVQVAGHRGYLRRADVWGLMPDEEVK